MTTARQSSFFCDFGRHNKRWFPMQQTPQLSSSPYDTLCRMSDTLRQEFEKNGLLLDIHINPALHTYRKIPIDPDVLNDLIRSCLTLIHRYHSQTTVKIICRIISGQQFICYIKNEGLRLSEAEQKQFTHECHAVKEKWAKILEPLNGNIGAEFTRQQSITFWFSLS